jgi:hypothetical protein
VTLAGAAAHERRTHDDGMKAVFRHFIGINYSGAQ